jgi:hypothetical protein
VDGDHRLPNILISAQQQFTDQLVKHRLSGHYFRIDSVPSHEQAPTLGLDIATKEATSILLGLGNKSATDFLGQDGVKVILRHVASNILIPNGVV